MTDPRRAAAGADPGGDAPQLRAEASPRRAVPIASGWGVRLAGALAIVVFAGVMFVNWLLDPPEIQTAVQATAASSESSPSASASPDAEREPSSGKSRCPDANRTPAASCADSATPDSASDGSPQPGSSAFEPSPLPTTPGTSSEPSSPPQDSANETTRPETQAPASSSAPETSQPAAESTPSTQQPSPKSQPATSKAEPTSSAQQRDQSWRDRVAELVNAERAAAGLGPIQLDSCLSDSLAQPWSAQLAAAGELSHRDLGQAMSVCPGFSTMGENVAYGQRTPEEVVAAWMDSPGHRANILNPAFSKLGMGQTTDGDGRIAWAQNFAG
ncbi:MAG: CAP domain-containing protein [Arachnia sp.]